MTGGFHSDEYQDALAAAMLKSVGKKPRPTQTPNRGTTIGADHRAMIAAQLIAYLRKHGPRHKTNIMDSLGLTRNAFERCRSENRGVIIGDRQKGVTRYSVSPQDDTVAT